MSDKKLFDKKCAVRVHCRVNYFNYYRFDQQVYVIHHLGPELSQDNSMVTNHWKNGDDKGILF